jgi:hypothetical protein
MATPASDPMMQPVIQPKLQPLGSPLSARADSFQLGAHAGENK